MELDGLLFLSVHKYLLVSKGGRRGYVLLKKNEK